MSASGIEALNRFQSAQANSSMPRLDSSDRAKLKESAKEFEAIFVKQMLDEMKKSLHKENRLFDGGQGEEIFSDMLYTEYSRMFAKAGNFGIANAIERQYEKVLPKDPYAK